MRKIAAALSAFACIAALSGAASAVVVGSFDSTRVLERRVLNDGADRDVLRAAIAGGGHVIAPTTGTLSASYLNGLDVFYTSVLGFGSSSSVLSAGEQTALFDWVTAGGILLSTGETPFFRAAYESVLNPFGIDLVSQAAAVQSQWVNDPSIDLLGNGVAGADLGDSGTGVISSGMSTVLALNSGNTVGLSAQIGSGLVVAIGDSNFLDDQLINPAGRQFFLNVLEAEVSPIPLPAGFLLMLSAIGVAGVGAGLRKRSVSAD